MYLRSPAVRWGLALVSGGFIAAAGLLLVEGELQYLFLAFAVVDVFVTAWVLEQAG